jgi:hypothetical protein
MSPTGINRRRRRGPPPTPATPAGLPYVPPQELGGRAHVVVDGAPAAGTALTLSHWPASPTPGPLARDLSAEIAFAYLRAPKWWAHGAEAVTNDHFDQDGLVSVFALCDPTEAVQREAMLVEVARAGDFANFSSRDAARAAFALATLADVSRSPLAASAVARVVGDEAAWSAHLYRELIDRLPGLCDSPGSSRELWMEEDGAFDASERAIASGKVTIEERPAADLAIARVDPAFFAGRASGAVADEVPVHPAAVHRASDAMRVLVCHGASFYCYERYETWVKFVSRRLRPRADLGPLAARLSEQETSGALWVADGPGALEPTLCLQPPGVLSSLSSDSVVDIVTTYLTQAPGAWDPFAAQGGYRPS